MAIPSKYIDGGDMENLLIPMDKFTNKEMEIKQIGGAEIFTLEEIVKLTEGVTDAPPKPETDPKRPKPPARTGASSSFCRPDRINNPPHGR